MNANASEANKIDWYFRRPLRLLKQKQLDRFWKKFFHIAYCIVWYIILEVRVLNDFSIQGDTWKDNIHLRHKRKRRNIAVENISHNT